MIEAVPLQAEALNISFKPVGAAIVILMMLSFLAIGYFFKVADTDGMWVAGRGIGNIENGMAIGANWMSAASYLGLAGLIALAGFYGLAFVIGWTTGYFILLIFMAAQMRRFGKYTAPDFVGDRFNSSTARALAAFTTLLIAYVYSVGQASGMGLVGQYVFGLDFVPMVIVMMAITIGYLALSGMLGATKGMAVQYVILIVAFLAGVYAVGFSQGYSTVLPQIEYGALIGELNRQFSEPFAGAGAWLWASTAFSLIVGTCGLPHVLVRFYTVESERTARWSTVWGLFFILLLYWAAPAMAAFGVDLFETTQGASAFAAEGGMTGAEGDVIVVLAAQFANLPQWFVGFVAAGAMAAAIATTAGLFITASSAVSHDIYSELINPDATQRQQVLLGRATIIGIGALVTLTALDPPALIGQLVALAFSLAGMVLFPMFFLGLWWENANRQGALAGMITGLSLWTLATINTTVLAEPFSPLLAEWVPGIGAALIGTPLVFLVTIVVSLVTPEPDERTKQIVRQCHSPEPMGQQQTAEDVVAADGGQETPADD